MVDDPRMRASDHARERTVRLLRRRCDEGYLSLDTFERRIECVYRAQDADELARLAADLPAIGVLDRFRQWRMSRRVGRPALPPDGVRLPLELVGERPLVLGRSRRCDIVLDDDTVSRTHASIRRTADGWLLRDLGSSNGTWVGGKAADGAERVVPGDTITLGACRVRLL